MCIYIHRKVGKSQRRGGTRIIVGRTKKREREREGRNGKNKVDNFALVENELGEGNARGGG